MATHARQINRLRRERERKGVLLVELAARAEVPAPTLSMIEGGFVPKPRTQLALAAALDMTPDELWPEEWERVADG